MFPQFKFPMWPLARRNAHRRSTQARCDAIEQLEIRQLPALDMTLQNVAFQAIGPNANDPSLIETSVRFDIVNSGDVDIATQQVDVRRFFSVDNVFGNADDIPAGGGPFGVNLQAGAAGTASISGSSSLADYLACEFLLVVIDSPNAFAEGNETNNVVAIPLRDLPTFVASQGQTTGRTNKAIIVDPQITFSDTDSQNFFNSTLTVSVVGDSGSDNTLSFAKIKTSDGVLRRKKDKLVLRNIELGTFAGGVNGQPLTIALFREVNSSGIQIIASHITLKGKKDVVGTRVVAFKLQESGNTTGPIATKEVNITA